MWRFGANSSVSIAGTRYRTKETSIEAPNFETACVCASPSAKHQPSPVLTIGMLMVKSWSNLPLMIDGDHCCYGRIDRASVLIS